MLKRRVTLAVLLTGLLSFGSACAPPMGIAREQVVERGTPTGQFVSCPAVNVAGDQQRAGLTGRTLRSGRSELAIQPASLPRDTTFSFATARSERVRIDVAPSVPLARPARLTIDLSHCPDSVFDRPLRIWRFPEQGGPGVGLHTMRDGKGVWTWVEHSSHYMIVN